jgi:serine/threonine-protein kinase
VVGIPLADAQEILEAEGFVIAVTIETTDQVAENTVISMDPPANDPALQGATVNLVVAGPPDGVSVPGFIIGQTEQAALDVLQAAPYEFNVTVDRVSSPSIAAGTVISISPGAQELVPSGGDITITVSDGPEPIRVPPVRGQTEGRARNELTNNGLIVVVVYVDVPPGSPDDGRVQAQDVEPGSFVDPGTTVTLTVGRSLEVQTTLPPTTTTTTSTVPETTTTVVETTTTLAATTTIAPTTTVP